MHVSDLLPVAIRWIVTRYNLGSAVDLAVPGHDKLTVQSLFSDMHCDSDIFDAPYFTVQKTTEGTSDVQYGNIHYTVKHMKTSNEGHHFTVQSVLDYLYTKVITKYGFALPALYHKEIQRDAPLDSAETRYLKAQLERARADKTANLTRLRADAVVKLTDLENLKNIDTSAMTIKQSRDHASKIADLTKLSTSIHLRIANLEAELVQTSSTKTCVVLENASRIANYLIAFSPKVPEAYKYSIGANTDGSGYLLSTLCTNVAFKISMLHPTIIDYFGSFEKNMGSESVIPGQCELFFGQRNVLHPTGKVVQIFDSNTDLKFSRNVTPLYDGILLRDLNTSSIGEYPVLIGISEKAALQLPLHLLKTTTHLSTISTNTDRDGAFDALNDLMEFVRIAPENNETRQTLKTLKISSDTAKEQLLSYENSKKKDSEDYFRTCKTITASVTKLLHVYESVTSKKCATINKVLAGLISPKINPPMTEMSGPVRERYEGLQKFVTEVKSIPGIMMPIKLLDAIKHQLDDAEYAFKNPYIGKVKLWSVDEARKSANKYGIYIWTTVPEGIKACARKMSRLHKLRETVADIKKKVELGKVILEAYLDPGNYIDDQVAQMIQDEQEHVSVAAVAMNKYIDLKEDDQCGLELEDPFQFVEDVVPKEYPALLENLSQEIEDLEGPILKRIWTEFREHLQISDIYVLYLYPTITNNAWTRDVPYDVMTTFYNNLTCTRTAYPDDIDDAAWEYETYLFPPKNTPTSQKKKGRGITYKL
jgi:hypothetical protein